MPSLVLEGGAFRTLFSAGVMDCLLDNNITFPYCIGVSGGATNCISYISKQKGRNLDIVKNFRNDPRYFSYKNLLKYKSLFGLDFAFEEITNVHLPFDMDTYKRYDGKLFVVVTNAITGEAEYLDGHDLDNKLSMIRATCAIPYIFPVVSLNNNFYYDGAIADPIPIKKAITDGIQKHLIVLSRPKGHIEVLSKADIIASKLLSRKFPSLKSKIIDRIKLYNDNITYCESLENEGNAIILRPSKNKTVDTFEKRYEKLKDIYEHGYEIGSSNLDRIKALF